MSDDEWVDPNVESAQRRRAAVLLLAIAAVAGLVVLLGVTVVKAGTGGSAHTAAGPGPLDSLTAAPAPSSSSAPTSPAPSSSGRHHRPAGSPTPSTTGSSSPSGPSVASCPTDAPCTLATDGGDLVGAINAYRTSHGVASVPGTVSHQAEVCAIGNGDSSACPQSYYWEPVSRWNGKDVLDKIVGNGGGASYLLDPAVTSFSVGWAYVPSGKQYLCAVVTHYH